ncbi:ankyrin repeat domain-containing protein [Wolbachia endosymbiont of Aedes albopictus]|nr:ankyrin repeat domain-containing protein [Wolbachia endosymbiont of Aedes albopictus]UVW84480.1 ankyrin repeat domain-containing protein [Wolbachia endosymbiont of Aedes albopictus]
MAARLGKLREVKDLLEKGANVNAQNDRKDTPLHLAVQNGHTEIVSALIKVEGIDINAKDRDGNTPLDLARTEEIKTLLKEAVERTDDGGESSTGNEGDPQKDAGAQQPDDNKKGGAGEGTSVEPASKEPTQTEEQPSSSGNAKGLQKDAGTQQKEGQGDNVQLHPDSNEGNSEEEEQPSSFFGNLFSIITKPFSLIISFFGGFFSWLFGSNGEEADESNSQSDVSLSTSDLLDYDTMNTDLE